MLAYRRRAALLDALSHNGSLWVRQTAIQLGVSEVSRFREALQEGEVGQRPVVMAVNDKTMPGAIAALKETGHAALTIAVSQGADRLALAELQRARGRAMRGAP